MNRQALSIDEVEAACDAIEALPDVALAGAAQATASELMAMGEDVMTAWVRSRGQEPTEDRNEGFRLLALHRQGSRGAPSFNACRETCRELVYHHNLVQDDPASAETAKRLRMAAMVARHLALFVGGKLIADGMGEFCCSSRPIRQGEAVAPETMES